MKELVVIGGPTAVGKTALSVALAKELNTVVISADSRQFYKEMSIGTAKPTAEEMNGIKHYFIDSHSVVDEVNAARFAQEASTLLDELFLTYDHVILTGGSGMFIDALCFGLDDIPHDAQIQSQLNAKLQNEGLDSLVKELQQVDPCYHQTSDINNPVRVIRALEVYRITGKPFSSFRTGQKKQLPYHLSYFVLNTDRNLLYERINLRVDKMIEAGLEEEAKSLLKFRDLKPLATVGYTEWFRYFDGEVSKEECIDLIKQNSRRYAKRQLTWFKRNPEAQWIEYDTTATMLNKVMNKLHKDC